MNTEKIIISAADQHALDCTVVTPKIQPKGAVVIVQEIFGVTDQLKDIACRYAELGYIALIPALFDRQGKDLVIPFDEGAKGRALMVAAKLENAVADIDAAVSHAKQSVDKVAVMGFCWGGGLALRSAQKLDIVGSIIFYGTRMPQYLDSPTRCPVIGHFGSDDSHVSSDDLQQVQDYLPDMQTFVYKAGHAFANDARADYVKDAASLAHQRSEAFLQKVLG